MANKRLINLKLIQLLTSLKNLRTWSQSSKATGTKMKNEVSIQWDSNLMALDTSCKEPFDTFIFHFSADVDLERQYRTVKSRVSSIWKIDPIQHPIWETRSQKWIRYSFDSWRWTWRKTSTWILCWISRWSPSAAWFRTSCYAGKDKILARTIFWKWVFFVWNHFYWVQLNMSR